MRSLAHGATPPGVANHIRRGAEANTELALAADHPMGRDQQVQRNEEAMLGERSGQWFRWMEEVQAQLHRLEPGAEPPDAREFLIWNYALHSPGMFAVPQTLSQAWTIEELLTRAGHVEVEVQAGRDAHSEYELRSSELRSKMRFAEFLSCLSHQPGNNFYITANNAAANVDLIQALAQDLAPLPTMLRPDPTASFLWIGGKTTTPLHHDLTQNLLIQHVGTKLVRLVPPFQQEKVDNHVWVHSRLGWLTPEVATERGIAFRDYLLEPGKALFVPVGWWHCVRSLSAFSVMTTHTNFWWNNSWSKGFV